MSALSEGADHILYETRCVKLILLYHLGSRREPINHEILIAPPVAAEGIFEWGGGGQTNLRGPLNQRGPFLEPRSPLFFRLVRFPPEVHFRGKTNLVVGKPVCEGP